MASPEQTIEAIRDRFGDHPRHRALHAKGSLYAGSFMATPDAARLTRAGHMQGNPVRAIVRFSNGGGDPDVPDYVPDVRGLAVAFFHSDGARTDISAQTVPRFPFRDPEPFVEFLRISKPGVGNALKLAAFLARHPRAVAGLRANLMALKPPASFASRPYYAFHAFRWLDADGGSRFVRYTWKPPLELSDLGPREAKARGRDYLREDLDQRLREGEVRFRLEVQIAAPDDDPHDPSAVWPEERERLTVGTLTVTGPTGEGEDLVFDPTRVIDGVELSDDPVLRFRPRVYDLSHRRRTET